MKCEKFLKERVGDGFFKKYSINPDHEHNEMLNHLKKKFKVFKKKYNKIGKSK